MAIDGTVLDYFWGDQCYFGELFIGAGASLRHFEWFGVGS